MVAGTKILSESSFGQMACMGRGCVPLLIHLCLHCQWLSASPGGPYSDLQDLQQLECFLAVSFGLPLLKCQSIKISPWQTQVLNIQHYRTLALIMKTCACHLSMCLRLLLAVMSTALFSSLFPSSSTVFTVSLQKLLILLLCF